MKITLHLIRLFLFTVLLGNTSLMYAQVIKTINVQTPGTLTSLITPTEKTTITNLTITGTIDARDFKTMREDMKNISVLDISGVTIQAYNGVDGPLIGTQTTYPQNEIPQWSFCIYPAMSNLSSIKISNTVASIGFNAFGTDNFKNVIVDSSSQYFTSINGVLYNKSATTIVNYPQGRDSLSYVIPNTVTTIGDNAFRSTAKLNSISIPNSVLTIGNYAFSGTKIESLIIPNSVISIGEYAFQFSQSKDIKIGNSVTEIKTGTFFLSSVKSITLGESISNFPKSAIPNCDLLSEFIVDANNLTLSSKDGVLFNKNQTSLILYPMGKLGSSYTIPNTVLSINDAAFQLCYLNALTIPNSVTSIGNYAFQGSGLTGSIIIPSSLTYIGDYAFSPCNGITDFIVETSNPSFSSKDGVLFNKNQTTLLQCPQGKKGSYTIPNTVTSITAPAFRFCSGLTEIAISKYVTSISSFAFQNCSGLTKILANRNTPPMIDMNTFYNVDKSTCVLVVPIGTKPTYQSTTYWNDFIIIVEASTDLQPINQSNIKIIAYHGKVSIKNLEIGSKLQIFTISGVKIKEQLMTSDQSDIFLPIGLYVIHIGNYSEKLVVK